MFEVDPTVFSAGATSTFTADQMGGSASTLVTLDTTANTGVGTGWIAFNGFTDSAVPVNGTFLGSDWQLWAEFDYTVAPQNPADTIAPGIDLFLTSLTFDIYGASGVDVEFNPTAITDFVDPTVDTSAATGVQLIGTGNLVAGVIEPTSQGGNAFNAFSTYSNTAFGDTFFVDPVPFYNVAFNDFNNTSQQIETDGDLVRIVSTGAVDFNVNAVPTPATMGLIGLGLIGLGFTTWRRRLS
ncbi:hypothetical protein CKO40_22275 [Halochromatium glycolicum]|uniref:Ice-binding protein C-terminal domain-containing protein n=1 Tax=Halochromatium glycolicum TaxID=85075 RepID=A0AAJ0U8B5_9GAMM|nr:hypothetical protein [Halochromatium glycolicum]